MNSEDARKKLDEKLSSMGYVHPQESKYTNTSSYMAYSGEGGDKDHTYSSQSYDTYSTFEKINENTRLTPTCPTCSESAVYRCQCSLGDLMCKKGHVWIVLKNGSVKIGDPHENE